MPTPVRALCPMLRKVRTTILSFLLVAPLMVIALSASDAAWAQEQDARQDADEILTATSSFTARLKALEQQATSFKPDGAPLRAKSNPNSKPGPGGSGGRIRPQVDDEVLLAKEHILLARQISAHKAKIRKLQARVRALETEARNNGGHEVGHQLGDSGGARTPATRPTSTRTPATPPSSSTPPQRTPATRPEKERKEAESAWRSSATPSFPALDAKSKDIARAITALETEARQIYKRPGRLK